ncbi:MAG: c-type cytochrome [Gammaproteobacteria bacterium]|nr:c-type cytochrome [Gammaproteobacteria bacterium]NND60463.1 cytochrome c5 family protein [Gammaproteobacteria bacterium]
MIVLGALVAFTFFVYFLANSIGDRTQVRYNDENPLRAQLVAERLSPVAQVAVEGEAAPVTNPVDLVPEEPPALGPAAAVDGEAVYQSACFACHMAGIAGAPKFADVEVWAPRIARGLDALYANAINGYQGEQGVMPAKGGRADLSDEQVRAAVDHMVEAAQ